ncbi:MAG: hypothetical protein ACJ75H_05040 [Thermoanaerobaculia bacterium]
MRIRPLPLLLLTSLVAIPALADDVYLVNGRKFEGVVAEASDSQVRIQMQGGTLSLPKDQVLRIEAGDSSLAEYLHRREALRKAPSTRAADWLELARWARSKGLDQAGRESALAAATLDPRLEGLAAVLRAYGYVLDQQVDRWVPYSELMRRRGFVLANGQWITREEQQANLRDQEEERARRYSLQRERERSVREDRLVALTELSIVRDLSRSAAPVYSYPVVAYPVVVAPGYWNGWAGGFEVRPPKPDPNGFIHVPGSLIPGTR